MATSSIVSERQANGPDLYVNDVFARGQVSVRHNGSDTTQTFPISATTPTSGEMFETLGGSGSGLVANRKYGKISAFVAGRSYIQWALAQSRIAPFRYYTKITPGTQTLTADPSTDAVNWALGTTLGGSSLFNDSEMVESTLQLQGNTPTTLTWLGEGLGSAAILNGRPANGTAASDAQLRVNGVVNTEGLIIANVNHVADPSAGTNTLVNGTATITTAASSLTCLIFLTRKGPSGASTGTLQVVSQSATQFVVESLDPAGAVVAADQGSFVWFIVNPAW